jgi:catechol 2,3-dioxygenase-like lactoylglutathione lyase family enzyme
MKDRNEAPRTALARRAPLGAQYRRHEDDARFLYARPRHAAGACVQGAAGLAFFEIPKGATPKADRNAIGTMQHVSFAVSEERFNDVKKRIEAARLAYLGPVNVGCDTWSIYVFDPNGIRLEFSHQREANPQVVARWRQTRSEALSELRTLSEDKAWLETLVAHLPERR